MNEPDTLEALYFPFSRSIDPASTKQMLLVFDTVHFLDPVDDEEWRACLMADMLDRRFGTYQSIAKALPTLVAERAVARQDPALLSVMSSPDVLSAALRDLNDAEWVKAASRPELFRLPHLGRADGLPATWEIFDKKLPAGFASALREHPDLESHVVLHGDETETWLLSYEAGSAIAIAVHSAAASELGVATVTDSCLHHRLLLSSAARRSSGTAILDATQDPTAGVALGILDDVLPRHVLDRVEFDDILTFREKSKLARLHFVRELRIRLSALGDSRMPAERRTMDSQLRLSLASELRQYRAEMAAVRDKCWPSLAGALGATLPAGGVAALALNYIGITQHALTAATAAVGLAVAKSILETRAARRSVVARSTPAVSYLSQVRDMFGG